MARQSGPANSQVAALCEAFPSLSLAAITDCLERYGDVEAAAAALLQVSGLARPSLPPPLPLLSFV